jgi:hypothetical protein
MKVKGWGGLMKNREEWRQIVQEAKAVAPRGRKLMTFWTMKTKHETHTV